ncbi:MAG TPA: hypothetical protein DEB39_05195 [Planctomycetaceae bacterium]|nr:hypothetical protein [Planctomycetaceae bacterium]
MTYVVERIDWDSSFLGYPVGMLELCSGFETGKLKETLSQYRSQFRLIFVALEEQGPETLPTPDAPCVCYDRKVVFKKTITAPPRPVDPHVQAYTSPICTKQMEQLAIKSGRYSRFKKDPELSPQYERLFLTWINNSVCNGLSDSIWTWRDKSKILGLMTLRYAKRVNLRSGQWEREARVGMLGVHDEYRRQGIGTALLNVCDFWCDSLNIPVASLITQVDNEATCGLCLKQGYKQVAEESVYHYWSPFWSYHPHRGWEYRPPVPAGANETAGPA